MPALVKDAVKHSTEKLNFERVRLEKDFSLLKDVVLHLLANDTAENEAKAENLKDALIFIRQCAVTIQKLQVPIFFT